MDIQVITTFINNCGFPIVMCVGCLYTMYKMNETHKQEIGELTKNISANTQVTKLLYERLGGEQKVD